MVSDNNIGDNKADEFSLESILAEYKGTAFINSEKKTPSALLNEQAEKILKEAAGDMASDSLFNAPERSEQSQVQVEQMVSENIKNIESEPKQKAADATTVSEVASHTDLQQATEIIEPIQPSQPIKSNQPPQPNKPAAKVRHDDAFDAFDAIDELDATIVRPAAPKEEPDIPALRADAEPVKPVMIDPTKQDEKDNAVIFFDNYLNQDGSDQDTIVRDVEKAIERELGSVRTAYDIEADGFDNDKPGQYGFDEEFIEDDYYEEPDLREAAHKFAVSCNSISLRSMPAAVLTITMIILTFAYEAGHLMPFGIGHDKVGATGMLLLGLLFVMILCSDIIVRGAMSLVKLTPNAESLIFLSCVFSFITSVFTMFSDAPQILPYCAVSALTLTCAAFGEKFNLRAMTETLKTAAGSQTPYGVHAEYYEDIDKSVLKKVYNRTDGFYNNLMHPDISELVYRFAAPVLIGASILFSLIVIIFRDAGGHFLHVFSATLAAAAPFSLLLAFSVPFGTVTKAMRRSGAALAGWGGADDVCFSDGAGVTDEDIFPPGTLSLSGMKIFDGASPEKAVRYTSSLIFASGSVLSGLFEEVLKTQGMNVIRIDEFIKHEGGISALIRGEHVATGSGAFMNLLGVRVPDDTNIKSAVYTSVNKKLVAMFNVDYTPINSVQSALISLHLWRIKMFFAVRDFNITPLMIEQKFRVPLDNFEFIQAKDSYNISDLNSDKRGRMAAILTREGLGPFAEAVTGGRLLKTSAFVATMVSAGSAVLGVLMMFYMFWSGAVLSARPGNLLLFMLAMLGAVLIVCGYVRCKK